MYVPSHRASSGRHVATPSAHASDPGRRRFLKSGLGVATLSATGLLIAEPAAAASSGLRLQLDRRSYAAGDIARIKIQEDVDYKRRMIVTGPHNLTWHKVDGGRNYSIFAAKVTDSGIVTVHMKNRITDTTLDTAQLELSVSNGLLRGAGAPFLAYGATSFFQSRVDQAPVDGASTTAFRNFVKSHPEQRAISYPQINGIYPSKWGTAFAEGSETDPLWTLTGTVPSAVGILRTQGFHAPEWLGEVITGTSDSPFCVSDRASGFTMFGGKSRVAGSHLISVGSAGLLYHSSNGLDKRNPRSNDARNWTSRGRISDSMVIRRDLVDHAIETGSGLGHVLHLFLVETSTAAGYCHPMVGAESGKDGFGAEGQRIAIAPTVDLTQRGLSPAGLAIARTLQQHGAYIGDNAGSSSALKAEQSSPAHDPWEGLAISQAVLKGVTWDDFVVLPKGWQ